MYFSRKKIVLAICSFVVLFMGYKVILSPIVKQGEQQVTKAGREIAHVQPKAISKKTIVLTEEQKKEVDKVKEATLIFQGPTYKKLVALTFDDGPDEMFTPQILDILRKYQVLATFFVLGANSLSHPDMLLRIDQEGHTIGNHSFNHPELIKVSSAAIDKQISNTEDIIWNIIKKRVTLFRPPYGAVNQRVISRIKQKNYKIIQWNIDTRDWCGRSSEQIKNTVCHQISPGAIVLQHSNGPKVKGTVEALPGIIEDLRSKGYEFVTIDQLLDETAYRYS